MNEPTRIIANEAMKPKPRDKQQQQQHHTFLVENRLRSILKTEYNKEVQDELADLQLDDIDNLEVLMDIEEYLSLPAESIPDEEFKKCKSFRHMMSCLIKYI